MRIISQDGNLDIELVTKDIVSIDYDIPNNKSWVVLRRGNKKYFLAEYDNSEDLNVAIDQFRRAVSYSYGCDYFSFVTNKIYDWKCTDEDGEINVVHVEGEDII